MQCRLLGVVIAVALLVAHGAIAGELVDKHDRFEGKRVLKWLSSVKSSDAQAMGLSASLVFSGDMPVGALAHIAGSFERLEFDRCHSQHWLADGEPVTPSDTSYQTHPRAGSPRVLEIMTSIFTVSQLRQLAAASVVEYKVCSVEGRVPLEDIEGIQRLLLSISE